MEPVTIAAVRATPTAGRVGRQQFDATGHYARPDVFHLVVDTRARPPVSLRPGAVPGTAPHPTTPEGEGA